MAHCLSRILSPVLEALSRLVHFLFASKRVVDAEGGTLAPVVLAKDEVAAKDPVATFRPDLQGVPALILSTMALGGIVAPKVSGPLPTIAVPGGPPIPRIVLTPPFNEKPDHKQQQVRSPLISLTGNVKRVHGRSPRKTRTKDEKENVRHHPNAPLPVRLPRPLPLSVVQHCRPILKETKNVEQVDNLHGIKRPNAIEGPESVVQIPEPVIAVQPGSSAWDREKCAHLKQARAFSDAVKARRRSLPTPARSTVDTKPLVRSASAPARLSLQERLRRAVADAQPSTPATTPARPKVPAPPLWGDENVSFVLEVDEEDDGSDKVNRAGTRNSTWSEVVSLDDYA